MNIDCDSVSYFSRVYGGDLTDLDRKCREYFSRYINSGISDIIYNVDDIVPSETRDWWGVRYNRTEEAGQPVSYKDHSIGKVIYNVYVEQGYDPIRVWTTMAKENSMRPWLSFRMNDVHYANEPLMHRAFFYTARENGWMIGDTSPEAFWYGYALDYAVKEVRDEQLAYMEEITQSYDAFGIELDFSRTIRCFKELGHHNIPIMTDFLRQVRALCDRAAEKWGHPIRIMIRLSTRVSWAMDYGFDVSRMVDEGLADVLVPTAYWGSTDSAIPIDEWKSACGDKEIPILYGIESNTVNFWHVIGMEDLAGYTMTAYARGADAVYLYNLFGVPDAWRIAASPEEAMKVPVRRYLTTMNNFRPKGYTEREAVYLPVTCSAATASEITFTTGMLDSEKTTLLCLGVKSGEGKTNEDAAAALTVTVNGTVCIPEGQSGLSCLEKYHRQRYEDGLANHYPWRIFTYRVPAGCDLTGDTVTVRFTAGEAVSIHYAELVNGDLS